MPTEARHDVLYRELSIVDAKEMIDIASPLLQEVINFATHVFVRCISYSDGDENVDLAPYALYRHIMELTDGIEVLVSKACPSPAIPLLRSSFEGLLALEYILEDSKSYVHRSLSWLTSYVIKRLNIYETLISTTDRGHEFLRAIEEDKNVRDFPLPPQDEIQDAIDNLHSLLSRNQFREIILERSKCAREPKWYSMFDGPKNLRELSRYLSRTAQYDVLYRQWSMSTHAQDFSPFITRDLQGEPAIRGLRETKSIKKVTVFATTFLLDATRILIEKFHPGEPWGNWYLREVRERYSYFGKNL